jgi:hypothetical protein
MSGRRARPGILRAAILAAALFIPPASRALHAADEPPPRSSSESPVSFQKVEKLSMKIALDDGGQVREPPAVERADRPVTAPGSERCSELTKPDSLRIFLSGTPHNHRAPPAL